MAPYDSRRCEPILHPIARTIGADLLQTNLAGKLLHIDVLDHVIIGEAGAFCSLRRDGKMPRD